MGSRGSAHERVGEGAVVPVLGVWQPGAVCSDGGNNDGGSPPAEGPVLVTGHQVQQCGNAVAVVKHVG